MSNYYISDLHFGHECVLKFCNRPFISIEEMNEELIKRWNKKVSKDDKVYILGDLIYKNSIPPQYYLDRLNGEKILIKGNHDSKWLKKIDINKYFSGIHQYLEISDEGRWCILFHYPIMDWNAKFRGSYHLHGHIHNMDSNILKFSNKESKMLNVSADVINFEPKTLDELIKWYKK